MSRSDSGKTEFIAARMARIDAEALRLQANQCGLTVSALIRRRVRGQHVTSCTDAETAKSIDRLGRMRKHLYPKDKDWASPEDRKRWWALVTELESTAKSLRR
jgi:hypothetical protein